MLRAKNILGVGCLAAILLFVAGCYETQYPLGAADKASVDPGYVGDFVIQDDKKPETIIIRNIDNHQYYVEWLEEGEKPMRMVGYTADVNGVTFANLRGLTEDGSIDNKFMIMRVSLSDDHSKLTVQSLKDDFFKNRNIDSSAEQEKVIGKNLNNKEMYESEPATAVRVPGAK